MGDPPCQAYSLLRFCYGPADYPDLVPLTQQMLRRAGKPFVIENVPDAPLRHELTLCGTMFDLMTDAGELWRHRHFETSWQFRLFCLPPCRHRRRSKTITNAGGGGGKLGQVRDMAARRAVMGI